LLTIEYTKKFKNGLRYLKRQRYDLSLLKEVINKLASSVKLPDKNRDHALVGNNVDVRECQIAPELLLIYKIDSDRLILVFLRYDPFYSEANQRWIEKSIKEVEKGNVIQHGLIEN
jgi:mRNA interferase YafQ